MPGVFTALRQLSRSKYVLVLVTNQSVVGRGIISLDEAMRINQQVIKVIAARGGRIDASYLCPHRPEEGCECRKPAPGMMLRAADELNLDLSSSYIIGDAVSDMQAAQAVESKGIMLLTGRGAEQVSLLEQLGMKDCLVLPDLDASVNYILSQREPP